MKIQRWLWPSIITLVFAPLSFYLTIPALHWRSAELWGYLFSVAVVFGAKVHEGGTLSAMLEDRMDTAISLYQSGKVEKILVSGDGRGEWSETKHMKDYAIAAGVAEEDILEDGEGYSTMETVTRTRELFGIEKCVFVTQKYHLYRAMYTAESFGMDVVGVNSDPRKYAGQLYREVREILARVKDFAICTFN